MSRNKVKIELIGDGVMPTYATEGSAGFDLIANNIKSIWSGGLPKSILAGWQVSNKDENIVREYLTIWPQTRVLVGVGFKIELPESIEMQVRPRSGLTLKTGLQVLNSPGTIDGDYRGEIGVILANNTSDVITIRKGDRIAQGVLAKYFPVDFEEGQLSETARGEGGYGSSDKS